MRNLEQMQCIKDKFYQELDELNNSDENIYLNFLSVVTLNTIYRAVVGDNLFNIKNFKDNNPDKYNYILNVEYRKSNYIKKIVDYNLEEMESNNVLDKLCKLLSLYVKDKDNLNSRNIKLDKDFKDKLIIDFLNNEDPVYKDIYLNMKKDNRILFLNEPFDNYNGVSYVVPRKDKNSNYIFINCFYDDFFALSVLMHELGHLKEYLELKQKLPIDEFVTYQLTSPYIEVNSMCLSLKFIKYLEKLGLPDDEIKFLRNEELIFSYDNINKLILADTIDGEEGLLSKLRYTYGGMISMFFDGIEDKNILSRKEDIFSKEKILNNDMEILDKIGCSVKCENYAVKKYIKKCL